MKSARNQLALLGLICMGLTWNDYLMPAFYIVAWVLCLVAPRRPVRLGGAVECLLLIAGAAAGHFLARALGYSSHFAIGHGLAFMQLVRLLRPLNRREQVFSLLIAFFHLAVACTFLFDYRFLAVLIAAVVLLPKALAELEAGLFPMEAEAFPEPAPPPRVRLGWPVFLFIVGVMTLFFLVFPRGLLTGNLRLPVTRPGDTATLLDTVLDPSRGGSANSRRILFQVQGERLGYLRCYTLAEFDGRQWRQSPSDYRYRKIEFAQMAEHEPGTLARKVRIKNPAFLGRVIPVDGQVLTMYSTFFREVFETRQGLIEANFVFSRQNNLYEYWIAREPKPQKLRQSELAFYTQHPPQSARLTNWLAQVLTSRTDPYDQARFLEQYFERNFTYQLGTPDLNRLNPTDDFIFNQRTGHCERYASALALLLRMQGIPSRVVIGYMPRTSNPVSGWYDVRLRDAHSWTEAWFAEKGWVRLDATPAATLPPPSAWSDWLEALDFAWYAHVVNFDAPTQNALVQSAAATFGRAAIWSQNHAAWLALLLLPAIAWFLWKYLRGRQWLKRTASTDEQRAQILAAHYYGRMLRALAKQGHHRKPQQTPLEFLAALRGRPLPMLADIEAVTGQFCLTRYGGRVLPESEQREIEAALSRVERANH